MAKPESRRETNLSRPEALRIAQVAHEAVRAWQAANGQKPAPTWARAPAWMKAATLEAVTWKSGTRSPSPAARHRQWMEEKTKAGWKLGPTKDARRKTHPLMVPYNQLPEVERRKDALVSAVVKALAGRLQ